MCAVRITAVHKIYLWAVLFLMMVLSADAAQEMRFDAADSSFKNNRALLVYYSRSNKTHIVADELSRDMAMKSVRIESKKNREGFFGILTCVLDQLMERDDDPQPLALDLSVYDTIYIASPVWIHKLSSPAMTFIKNSDLKGKEVYVVLTYNGSQSETDEKELKDSIVSQGIFLKGLYKIITKKKDENEIRQESAKLATLLNKRVVKR